MENPLVMKWNENILWISIILLTYLGVAVDRHYLIVILFWVVIILSVGNTKRLFSEKYFAAFTILRRGLYVIPFFFPFFFHFKVNLQTGNLLMYSGIGFIIGFLFILPKWNEIRIMLSKEMIEFSKKQKRIEYFTTFFMLIGAAIGEELFFRHFIIGNLEDSSFVLAIIISALLFFLNHFGVKWNSSFYLYDYLIQIIFSIVSASVFILTNSIIPSIIMHIVYNSPLMLLSVKSFHFHYLNNTVSHSMFEKEIK